MTQITSYQSEIILGAHDKIIFFDENTNSITKKLIISEHDVKKDESIKNFWQIQNLAISPNGQILALTTSTSKLLILYKIDSDKCIHLSTKPIPKTCSCITFSKDSKHLLLCDKSGDCFDYDCTEFLNPQIDSSLENSGKWILGHLSIILDGSFSPDQKYIVTSDRDEKIRITNFPNSYEIECYCLGHTEYVSGVKFLSIDSQTFLISLSGDSTIKIWQYLEGKCIFEITLLAPGIKFAIKKISEYIFHIAVTLSQDNDNLCIYELKFLEKQLFTSQLISKFSFPSRQLINLCYCDKKLFLILLAEYKLYCEIINNDNGTYRIEKNNHINSIIEDILGNAELTNLEDVSTWFKKKIEDEYSKTKKIRTDENLC